MDERDAIIEALVARQRSLIGSLAKVASDASNAEGQARIKRLHGKAQLNVTALVQTIKDRE